MYGGLSAVSLSLLMFSTVYRNVASARQSSTTDTDRFWAKGHWILTLHDCALQKMMMFQQYPYTGTPHTSITQ